MLPWKQTGNVFLNYESTLGEEVYLAYSILSYQNVSGRQVSVYEGLLREVAHPGCNLAAVTQQGLGCGLLPRTREEGKEEFW